MSIEHQKAYLPQCLWNTRNYAYWMSTEHQKVCLPQCPWNTRKYAYLNVHGTPESMSTSVSMEHKKICPPQCPQNTRKYAHLNVQETPVLFMPITMSIKHENVCLPQLLNVHITLGRMCLHQCPGTTREDLSTQPAGITRKWVPTSMPLFLCQRACTPSSMPLYWHQRGRVPTSMSWVCPIKERRG